MNIGVLGAGSIGLHLSAQLWLGGHKVTVICRQPEQATSINKNGLTYIDIDGHTQQILLNAFSLQDTPEPWDWIFLTVKQTQIPSAISYLQEIKGTLRILCFQNGIGHQEQLKEKLPHAKIYLGVTTEGAYRQSPAIVRHTGKGLTTLGMAGEGDLRELTELFSKTEIKTNIEDDINERIWKKLITNACINPLTALLEVHNGKLLELPFAKQGMEKLFLEAQEVARLEGVNIDHSLLQEIVNVCRNTYLNKSSMLQDIEAGRETEIEFINGAIFRIGQQHGYNANQHSLLRDLIRAKENLTNVKKQIT